MAKNLISIIRIDLMSNFLSTQPFYRQTCIKQFPEKRLWKDEKKNQPEIEQTLYWFPV